MVASKHVGNSQALINEDSSSILIPIHINYILQVCISDTIQTFLSAGHYHCLGVVFDPFRFPMLQAEMWSSELGPIEILAPDHIHTHFAKASLMWEGMAWLVIVSLCHVSHSFQVAAIVSDYSIEMNTICSFISSLTVLLRPTLQSHITAKKITHPKCFSFALSKFF
jgi:hypothetical protein